MKEKPAAVCPGCKRHCPMGATRCKYGERYFSAPKKKEPSSEGKKSGAESAVRRPRKWERNMERGSLAWSLVSTGRKAGKALNKGKITEARLLDGLDEAERRKLRELLLRISGQLNSGETPDGR